MKDKHESLAERIRENEREQKGRDEAIQTITVFLLLLCILEFVTCAILIASYMSKKDSSAIEDLAPSSNRSHYPKIARSSSVKLVKRRARNSRHH